MSKNTITKEALASSLKSLMKVKPLSKISVKDITEYCNISRNSFYYHFTDKYDLINWIFYSETLKEVNIFFEPDRWAESFINLCKYLNANSGFYRHAFRYVGQNSLSEYLLEFYFELVKIHVDTSYAEIGFKLDPDELYLIARMQAHSYVGIIMDWVRAGMSDDYMNYFERLKRVYNLEKYRYSM